MKIKDYKCKCGHDDFFFADKGNQKGVYCSYCGKWLKWADKDEQNLSMKQEPILDKIRAEIEQVKSIMNEEIINHDSKDLINFVNGLNQSLVIINKYKAESEDKE